jgi:hypothetical protein
VSDDQVRCRAIRAKLVVSLESCELLEEGSRDIDELVRDSGN